MRYFPSFNWRLSVSFSPTQPIMGISFLSLNHFSLLAVLDWMIPTIFSETKEKGLLNPGFSDGCFLTVNVFLYIMSSSSKTMMISLGS